MNSRDRVLAALKMQTPDRAPTSARFHAGFMKVFNEKTGANLPERYLKPGHAGVVTEPLPGAIAPEDYFGCDIRHVMTLASRHLHDYSDSVGTLPDNASVNEWGIVRIVDPHTYSERRVGPLVRASSVQDILRYKMPDVDADYRWQGLIETVDAFRESGYATSAFFHATFFELICDLRGYEQFLLDLYAEPELTEALIDLVTDVRIRQAVGLAKSGVDILRVGDNFGAQHQLLISPVKWRELFKPGLEKLIGAVKAVRPDIFIVYKADGNIESIIPDLVEMGVDALCPVQAESMDAREIKKRFGSRLGMWGTIGTQTLLPFGTPAEVKQKVWENMRTLGAGGGLVITPDQMVLPDVPWENMVAFFDAVHSFRW
jgi:uroporphyrinogen decarboxylase